MAMDIYKDDNIIISMAHLLYLYLIGKKIKNLYFIYRISDIHTMIYYLNSIIIQHKIK
jgi:hypothetical protein